MDDLTNQQPERSDEEEDSNNDVALAIVFGVVGVTLLLTLDTPWAGLPMLVLGLFYLAKSLRDAYKKRA